MKVYLVGGAVRDQLLGLPVKEKDWVVVGATISDMLALHYKQVGKDFPVFLHPNTKEEYALARLEKKVSKGYTGFEFVSDPNVTLEEDLKRRDLTINAIAMDGDGKFIDPFHGQADIQAKKLRHVSNAFEEDPVRILRLARFAARFAPLGFTVADETMTLCRRMVENGEVDALVAERVWKECSRALAEAQFDQFFKVLDDGHATAKLFPEIDFTRERFALLNRAATLSQDPEIRFAVTLFDVSQSDGLIKRLRIPNSFAALAELVNHFYAVLTQSISPEALLNCFERADAFRREERFLQLIEAVEIISELRLDSIIQILQKVKTLDLSSLNLKDLSGIQIKAIISAARLKLIQSI